MGPELIDLLTTGYALGGYGGAIGAGLAFVIWRKMPEKYKDLAKGLLKKKEPEE
jgi:hypothetical protein